MSFSRLLKIGSFFSVLFILSLALNLMTALSAKAAMSHEGITYSLEPIVGYDFEKKENPARRTRVFTYGGRLIAGYRILSAEAEYTIGNSDETFSDISTRIEEKTETARVGLRSTYSLGMLLDWYLRGGAEDQKHRTTQTVAGVATTNNSPSKVYPYVGTGVSLRIASQLSVNASVIAVVKDRNDMKQNDYTTTLGVTVNFNTH